MIMSYILDALKKSDIQAQTGKLPSIHSHAEPAQSTQRPVWQAMLGGSLITVLLVIAAMQVLPLLETKVTTQATVSKAISSKVQPEAMVAPPPAHAVSTSPAVNVAGRHVEPAANIQAVESAQPIQSVAPTAPTTMASAEVEALPVGGQASVLRSELPVAVQQALPPIQISGHIFDKNPAARMVFINGHIQHQGDNISPQLKLISITPTGVEMKFRASVFRINIIRR